MQIELTYNSNHIEGSRLTHDQTRYIFETNTVDAPDGAVNVDDILETVNHFRCIDLVIDQANRPLSESLIKQLHRILKTGTADSRKNRFAVGDYKKRPNMIFTRSHLTQWMYIVIKTAAHILFIGNKHYKILHPNKGGVFFKTVFWLLLQPLSRSP